MKLTQRETVTISLLPSLEETILAVILSSTDACIEYKNNVFNMQQRYIYCNNLSE